MTGQQRRVDFRCVADWTSATATSTIGKESPKQQARIGQGQSVRRVYEIWVIQCTTQSTNHSVEITSHSSPILYPTGLLDLFWFRE